MTLEILPAGRTFLRPGGREGKWRTDPQYRDPDDQVASPFPFVTLPGQDAEHALDALRRLHPETTPILFGSPHEAGILFERFHFDKMSPAEHIAKARSFDLDAWLADRQYDYELFERSHFKMPFEVSIQARVLELEAWLADRQLDDQEDPDNQESFPPRGPWPEDAQPMTALAVPKEFLKPGPKPVVIIGLLPTTDPTETAAYLQFGAWNDCPEPAVHICFARRWRDKYGTVQVSNTYESVEFRVAKPLTDRQEALDLAWQQYHYCTDSIPGTLEESGASLIGSTVWHFWWD